MSYTLRDQFGNCVSSFEAGGMRIDFTQAAEGGYCAEIPAFPGCVSFGDSLEAARANIIEAAAVWMETRLTWMMSKRGAEAALA